MYLSKLIGFLYPGKFEGRNEGTRRLPFSQGLGPKIIITIINFTVESFFKGKLWVE